MHTKDAISAFLFSRKAKGLSRQTLRWYEGILNYFELFYKKLPKTPMDIERFISLLEVGDERRHGYYRALRCFYNFLHSRYKIKNLVSHIEPPRRRNKIPKILSPPELQMLLNVSSHYPEFKAAILFLVDTGARLGEYATLTIERIQEYTDGYIAIIKGKVGERQVPICYETYHALMVSPPKCRSTSWLSHRISRIFKEAGLHGSAHTLRHTFGTLWGGDELVLQKIMGHSNLTTTQRYRHLRALDMIQQHNIYSPLKKVLSETKKML